MNNIPLEIFSMIKQYCNNQDKSKLRLLSRKFYKWTNHYYETDIFKFNSYTNYHQYLKYRGYSPFYSEFSSIHFYEMLSFKQFFPESYNKILKCNIIDGPICIESDTIELPEGLTHLTINYNCKINKLPDKLTYLKVGFSYDRRLPPLPENLEELLLMLDYNHKIEKFPKNLKKIVLSNCYNHKIDKFPKKLRELQIGKSYSHSLPELPNSLIYFSYASNHIDLPYLPDNINILHIGRDQNIERLPSKLKSLYLMNRFNSELPDLPETLEYLYLSYMYDKYLPVLPEGLKILDLGLFYNKPIIKLPESLERINLSMRYEHPLPNIPKSLKFIKMDKNYSYKHLITNAVIEYINLPTSH
jgi:hypothetical protein